MYDILPWVGLGVLFFLCLPIPLTQKIVLEVSSWVLRLGLVGLLAGGVYLWFRPGEMPGGITRMLADNPPLMNLLPPAGSPTFGLCLACWVVAACVPLLAALDMSRRACRIRMLATERVILPPPEPALPTAEPIEEVGVPVLRPIERRTAAAALATAGSRTTR